MGQRKLLGVKRSGRWNQLVWFCLKPVSWKVNGLWNSLTNWINFTMTFTFITRVLKGLFQDYLKRKSNKNSEIIHHSVTNPVKQLLLLSEFICFVQEHSERLEEQHDCFIWSNSCTPWAKRMSAGLNGKGWQLSSASSVSVWAIWHKCCFCVKVSEAFHLLPRYTENS